MTAAPQHSPEPWLVCGRTGFVDAHDDYLFDAQSDEAGMRFPEDARRIIAAVNALAGVPTAHLEQIVKQCRGQACARLGMLAASLRERVKLIESGSEPE